VAGALVVLQAGTFTGGKNVWPVETGFRGTEEFKNVTSRQMSRGIPQHYDVGDQQQKVTFVYFTCVKDS